MAKGNFWFLLRKNKVLGALDKFHVAFMLLLGNARFDMYRYYSRLEPLFKYNTAVVPFLISYLLESKVIAWNSIVKKIQQSID